MDVWVDVYVFLSHNYTDNMDSTWINHNCELYPLFLLHLWMKTITTSLIWVPLLRVHYSLKKLVSEENHGKYVSVELNSNFFIVEIIIIFCLILWHPHFHTLVLSNRDIILARTDMVFLVQSKACTTTPPTFTINSVLEIINLIRSIENIRTILTRTAITIRKVR